MTKRLLNKGSNHFVRRRRSHRRQGDIKCRYLPFRFTGALVSNDADVSDLAYACFGEERVDFFLVSLKVDAGDEHSAVVTLGFLGLLLSLLQASLEGLCTFSL